MKKRFFICLGMSALSLLGVAFASSGAHAVQGARFRLFSEVWLDVSTYNVVLADEQELSDDQNASEGVAVSGDLASGKVTIRRTPSQVVDVEASQGSAEVGITEIEASASPDSDAANETAEEAQEVQDTTSLQQPEVSEEEKSRALSTGSSDDAPDASVKLPDGEVAAVDVQNANEQTPPPAIVVPHSSKARRNPNAEKAVRDMTNDMLENLKKYGGGELYQRWRAYNASIRRRTNSLQTGNELNSRCRLKWYERLYQDPLNSVSEVEQVSHALGQRFMGNMSDVITGVRTARNLTDVALRNERFEPKTADSPQTALENLKAALVEASSHHAKALAPMSKNDLAAVMAESHAIFCGQVQSGHTVQSRGRAQYLIDAMEKSSKSEMYNAGEAILACLTEENLRQLANVDFGSLEKAKINGNQTVGIVKTEAGDILIGDSGRTVWELDKYPNACCVVDLGGADVYREGSCVLNRPLLVVIDLGGADDEYVGKNAAIQGGSILGVSVWYDDGGADTYLAKDICQGSTIGGFGVLINEKGNNKYLGFLRCQGTSICGFGLLLDRDGDDDYRGALFAQGVGGPGGFGGIVDCDGKDHYYVGGYYFDSYPEHPGYDGWGQGIGAGIRRVACGGIGVLLDGGGDDAYEYDYFAHGGGYWMGVGFARDFGGNDIRYAATSTMYDGSARRERRWQRFGTGFGCHYAVGYLIDDSGNDVYGGTIMGTGMGWDLGAGFLVDFEGNDSFESTGGLTQGSGGEGSIGVLMNYRGNDTYMGNYQAYAATNITYHSPSNCGANFSFVVDHGGRDSYGGYDNYRRPIQNNAITQRGNITGLLIDRPAPGEENAQATADQTQKTALTTNGMPVKSVALRTMVPPPPLYDTNPHPQSNGVNAFNPSATSDAGGAGGRPFGGFFGGGRFFQ